jgi:hypothetical protein
VAAPRGDRLRPPEDAIVIALRDEDITVEDALDELVEQEVDRRFADEHVKPERRPRAPARSDGRTWRCFGCRRFMATPGEHCSCGFNNGLGRYVEGTMR